MNKEALKQEQDEPVAYGMRDTMIGAGNRMMYVRLDKGQDGCTVPLYTKPQAKEWVGLTRSQVLEIVDGTTHPLEFYRAIEHKLKEVNDL